MKFRRPIYPQPHADVSELTAIPTASPDGSRYESDWMSVGMGERTQFWRCPYGQPGDTYCGVVEKVSVVQQLDGKWLWVAEAKQTPGGA